MDPLTALGLAGNIVQFIDFSCKILSDSYEIYRAGSTSEHEEINFIATDLSTLADRIQHGLGSASGLNGPINANEQVGNFLKVVKPQCCGLETYFRYNSGDARGFPLYLCP